MHYIIEIVRTEIQAKRGSDIVMAYQHNPMKKPLFWHAMLVILFNAKLIFPIGLSCNAYLHNIIGFTPTYYFLKNQQFLQCYIILTILW